MKDTQVYKHVGHLQVQGLRKSLASNFQENEHELS